MEQKEKFLPFLSYVEELIRFEVFQHFDLFGFFEFIMTRVLESREVEHLRLLMDHFTKPKLNQRERQHFFEKKLKVNSRFLQYACDKDYLEMVKVFIKYKCDLSITSETIQQLHWTAIPNPWGIKEVQQSDSKVLKILRMMATKSYMLGCYQAMIETIGIQDCQCGPASIVTNPKSWAQETLRSEYIVFQTALKEKNNHDCPAHVDFMPNFMDCEHHVECHDPISK